MGGAAQGRRSEQDLAVGWGMSRFVRGPRSSERQVLLAKVVKKVVLNLTRKNHETQVKGMRFSFKRLMWIILNKKPLPTPVTHKVTAPQRVRCLTFPPGDPASSPQPEPKAAHASLPPVSFRKQHAFPSGRLKGTLLGPKHAETVFQSDHTRVRRGLGRLRQQNGRVPGEAAVG